MDSRRPGEIQLIDDPARVANDASLVFIGHIETPWSDRHACPRRGKDSDAVCRIAMKPQFLPGLKSVEGCSHLHILYWMHEARRDLIVQAPAFDETTHGVFALRSPARPNPIALSVVELLAVHDDGLSVRGLDCLNGTPLIDIKPYFAATDSVPHARVAWRETITHPGRRSTGRTDPVPEDTV
ncbi:tRNA (N6-threonylcarbamoyladenosine(37)-N6)-methyltransferase TrmO [Breoghania sp. L-A4]|nr:tRNA (N6-threonylcarbamoyladenosine(37)-N6)-methyltransferase TrmO [Breoghania sp. L-A4]AXS41367.1 tRNA (N6-threonylcarbamoyladenosine(37)-N6)-methyltransferase TrmO [Breoghania sp. L-A4]